MDWSPPSSSVHGILQARIWGWVAISFSRRSSWPRDWTRVSCTAGRFFILWATMEAPVHDYWKTKALTIQTFVSKVMSLLFNTLSRFVIAFLLRSKCLLILWLQSPSAVVLEPKKIKSCQCFHCFPIFLPWSDGTRCHDLSFFVCWVLSQLFHSPLSLSSRGSLVLHFLP